MTVATLMATWGERQISSESNFFGSGIIWTQRLCCVECKKRCKLQKKLIREKLGSWDVPFLVKIKPLISAMNSTVANNSFTLKSRRIKHTAIGIHYEASRIGHSFYFSVSFFLSFFLSFLISFVHPFLPFVYLFFIHFLFYCRKTLSLEQEEKSS